MAVRDGSARLTIDLDVRLEDLPEMVSRQTIAAGATVAVLDPQLGCAVLRSGGHGGALGTLEPGCTARSSVQGDSNVEDVIRVALIGERNTEDSYRKSQATRRGKRRRFETGQAVGGPLNDGYRLVTELDADGHVRVERDGRDVHRRELDPARVPLIEEIFALVEQGRTPGDVARLLNRRGSVTRTGKRWTTRAVRDLVQNRSHASVKQCGSRWVVARSAGMVS